MKLRVVKKPNTAQNTPFPDTLEIHPPEANAALHLGRFKGNDLVLPDVSVSRRHAELHVEDGAVVVSDLNSKFGTFVNSRRLAPFTKATLAPRDTLQIGKVVLVLEEVETQYAAADGGVEIAGLPEIADSPARSTMDDTIPLVIVPPVDLAALQAAADDVAAFVATPDAETESTVLATSAEKVAQPDMSAKGAASYNDTATTETTFVEGAVRPDVSADLYDAATTEATIVGGAIRPDTDDDRPMAFVAAPAAEITNDMAAPVVLSETESDDEFIQRTPILRIITAAPPWLPWAYLGAITLAEWVTAAVNVQLGIGLHTFILLGLVLQGALSRSLTGRNLMLSLAVAPLIRILSLSLPLLTLPQLLWYPLVATPLLTATWIIARQLGISRQAVGLRFGGRSALLQLMMAGGGLGLGVLEYSILHPKPLVTGLTVEALLLPALSLTIFTGFNEEVIFRGLLQSTALPTLRRWALIYVSLLFAVLHIGYLSLSDVVFVFIVGLSFAYIVRWSGTILGVTLAHGMTNVTLFLFAPYIAQNPNEPVAAYAPTVVAISVGLSLLALAGVMWQAGRSRKLLAVV